MAGAGVEERIDGDSPLKSRYLEGSEFKTACSLGAAPVGEWAGTNLVWSACGGGTAKLTVIHR